ncbi:MAG: hypothetical protein WC314_27355 [Vulcanimicrobiota bacterium]
MAVLAHVVVAARFGVMMARFVADQSADGCADGDTESTGERGQRQSGEPTDERAAASAGIPKNLFGFTENAFSEAAYFAAEPGANCSSSADAQQSEWGAYNRSRNSAYYFSES